ncbi:type II secretion system F family protein [Halosegnis longus]|uniref:type II secretion system F family protein n=1 Tax=Halosegnis longus TaxID=2216012 RepID=UPI00129DD77B|nr:hypothetical protein [Halosegnis longus]
MGSVRALAQQAYPRRVAHALFARHASDWRRARRSRGESIERYVVRLYAGAWLAALAVGTVAGAIRGGVLSGLLVGVATVAGVRLLLVRAGFARLRLARWRRARRLERALPRASATLRRCVAGTTDRSRLLEAVASAEEGPTAEAFASLRHRAELEGTESALEATARTTGSPAFADCCRALCGPEQTLPARLDALDVTRERGRVGRFVEAMARTLRTRTRPRTRRRQTGECEQFLDAVTANLRAGATLSDAVGRAATGEHDALAREFDRLAGGVAVDGPRATRRAFEQFAARVDAPTASRDLRRVAAALACDCPPAVAVGGVSDATTTTSVGERQRS